MRAESTYGFLLLGGEIDIINSFLLAEGSGSSLDIASFKGQQSIDLSFNNNVPSFNLSPSSLEMGRANIKISDFSFVGNANAERGNVRITADDIDVLNNSLIFSSTFSPAFSTSLRKPNSLTLNASGSISIRDSSEVGSQVASQTQDIGSDVTVAGKNLYLENGSSIYSIVFGQGTSGNVSLLIGEDIEIDGAQNNTRGTGIYSKIESGGSGQGGSIEIKANSLLLKRGGQISTSLSGQGQAGDIKIEASSISLDRLGQGGFGTQIANRLERGGVGPAGTTLINSDFLSIKNGARLDTSTLGQGDGGELRLNIKESTVFSGVGSTSSSLSGIINEVGSGAVGRGGDTTLDTGSLLIQDGAGISSTVFGTGDGGDITINARQEVELDGNRRADEQISRIVSQLQGDAVGVGGTITINTPSLRVVRGAQIGVGSNSREFSGKNITGNVIINATERVLLSGTSSSGSGERSGGIFNNLQPGSLARSGEIIIRTEQLDIQDGARISSSSASLGTAGNILVQADKISLSESARISSDSAIALSGDIKIDAIQSLSLSGDSQISTVSKPEVQSLVQLLLIAAFAYPSPVVIPDGNGGTLEVEGEIVIPDGEGGNIEINSPNLLLDESQIASESITGKGGDIFINRDTSLASLLSSSQSGSLLLRNSSFISASSGDDRTNGDGGNIVINIPFLLSFPEGNSDIIATAFEGNGGSISINSNAILNFQLQAESNIRALRSNQTNDISASSELGRTGSLNVLGLNVDPSQGTAELPTALIDGADQVDQSCKPQSVSANSFTRSGRSGIPLSPGEFLIERESVQQWIALPDNETAAAIPRAHERSRFPHSDLSQRSKSSIEGSFQEASSWQRNSDGRIRLIAATAVHHISPHC